MRQLRLGHRGWKMRRFLRRLSLDKDSLQYIDGWASHSYPNPGFLVVQMDTVEGR